MSLTDNSSQSTMTPRSGASLGSLTITATPIGNLGDLSPRARASLEDADIIACEDTRHTGLMLARLGIKPRKLLAYHDHSAPAVGKRLIKAMGDGKAVTLVCDAGTPLIADPGFRLVRGCRDAGIRITTMPGASSVLAALSIAGLPTDRFFFGGFLAPRRPARIKELEALGGIPATLIFFESPRRLVATLRDVRDLMPMREVAVAREMTKLHEDIRLGTAETLLAGYDGTAPPRGEIVVLIAPPATPAASAAPDEAALHRMLKRARADGLSRRDAAALISKTTGLPRRKIYGLSLKADDDDDER